MRILFMGTPDLAEESLRKLVESNYEICGVVTTPDRPAGRGMKMLESPVKTYAKSQNFTIFQPEKVANNTEFKDEIRALNPDLVCVVAYGVILPKSFLKIPKYGCINIHPSLLPKYRGSAPIQWAVLNGDKTTGVSIMYLNEKMDAGDIIAQEEVEIGEDETTGELWDRLSGIGAELLLKTVQNIENGNVERTPQSDEYTMAPMLNREISKIDWENKTALEIKNLVRGLNPFMGAYTYLNDKKIKIWKVQIVSKDEFDTEGKKDGEVLLADSKKGLFINVKNEILSVLEIQGENSKRMGINDFLRGNKINVGEIFK